MLRLALEFVFAVRYIVGVIYFSAALWSGRCWYVHDSITAALQVNGATASHGLLSTRALTLGRKAWRWARLAGRTQLAEPNVGSRCNFSFFL
jgi:hypothetical protein